MPFSPIRNSPEYPYRSAQFFHHWSANAFPLAFPRITFAHKRKKRFYEKENL